MSTERYTVWGVDRAGVPWDIESFDNPLHALRRYNVEIFSQPWREYGRTFGISDYEDTDGRMVNTDELDLSYCDANYTGERCYTPLDDEGLCAFRGFHENEGGK